MINCFIIVQGFSLKMGLCMTWGIKRFYSLMNSTFVFTHPAFLHRTVQLIWTQDCLDDHPDVRSSHMVIPSPTDHLTASDGLKFQCARVYMWQKLLRHDSRGFSASYWVVTLQLAKYSREQVEQSQNSVQFSVCLQTRDLFQRKQASCLFWTPRYKHSFYGCS